MCNGKTLFTDLALRKQSQNVTLGDGYQVKAAGGGTVMLDIELSPGNSKKCKLTDVLYAPDLTFSLISGIAQARDVIRRTMFTKDVNSWMLVGRLWLQEEG